MLKDLIRSWLGLDTDSYLAESRHKELSAKLKTIQSEITAHNSTITRAIVANNPLHHLPEWDPARKAQSDTISAMKLARASAEQKVRDQYGYNPPEP